MFGMLYNPFDEQMQNARGLLGQPFFVGQQMPQALQPQGAPQQPQQQPQDYK